MTMPSMKELLKDSLDELSQKDLKAFKWHLNELKISKSEMENADVLDTVDKMVARFGPDEAVEITVKILRNIKQNHLAKLLEDKYKKAQAEGNAETSSPVGADSKQIRDAGFLTLDLNTAHKRLSLSEENRKVTFVDKSQPYPDHPDRFDAISQVLCRESVSEQRSYWEIEWGGPGVCITVSYKSISRKGYGKETVFGNNDQSWSLFCSPSSYSFKHNNILTELPVKPISRRVGVCVDPSAGTLSYYSVSDTLSLIHTVQTTFTKPLYPGFSLYNVGSSVKLLMNENRL